MGVSVDEDIDRKPRESRWSPKRVIETDERLSNQHPSLGVIRAAICVVLAALILLLHLAHFDIVFLGSISIPCRGIVPFNDVRSD